MYKFEDWLTQPKGCLAIGVGGFVLASIGVSISLIFGGDINEVNYDFNTDSEYTSMSNLRASFIIMIICIVFYFIWKNNMVKNDNDKK